MINIDVKIRELMILKTKKYLLYYILFVLLLVFFISCVPTAKTQEKANWILITYSGGKITNVWKFENTSTPKLYNPNHSGFPDTNYLEFNSPCGYEYMFLENSARLIKPNAECWNTYKEYHLIETQ